MPSKRAIDDVVISGAAVIGTGVAGLTAAIELARAQKSGITLITCGTLGSGGSSSLAQGGVAAALGPDDSPTRHAADTVAVGGGISDRQIVDLLCREGPGRINTLRRLGARFDCSPTGLCLGREAGHSRRRIVHASGDRTGAELVRTLTEAVRCRQGVAVAENTRAIDLVVDAGRIAGLVTRDVQGTCTLHLTPVVVLATGGIGQLYAHTTNPSDVRGDGLAMAARAGARLIDLEFVQFHPTALRAQRDPMPLLTEALRGEGAVLVDESGHRFMPALHPAAELAPRDVVARAIWDVLDGGNRAYLDARATIGAAFPQRFPNVFQLCMEQGIDPRSEALPVAPAAHYHMGGVEVDTNGRSSIAGLWVVGEAACTGAHGANRLASNSLLEAMVFGARVANDIVSASPRSPTARGAIAAMDNVPPPANTEVERGTVRQVRQLMWSRVGLVRSASGMVAALGALDALAHQLGRLEGQARNMIDVARLITTAALARRESCGAHYRSDAPRRDTRKGYRLRLTHDARRHSQVEVAR